MDFFNDMFHNLAFLEFYFLDIIYILLYIDFILSIFFQHSNILTRASHHWCLASNIVLVLCWSLNDQGECLPAEWYPRGLLGGCFTNVSQALQNNLAKIHNTRNLFYGENFKLKLYTCVQSKALGTGTKFQLEILIRNTISAIHRFRENILESLRNVSEKTSWDGNTSPPGGWGQTSPDWKLHQQHTGYWYSCSPATVFF